MNKKFILPKDPEHLKNKFMFKINTGGIYPILTTELTFSGITALVWPNGDPIDLRYDKVINNKKQEVYEEMLEVMSKMLLEAVKDVRDGK